jgi:S-adenosylmethionine-diacylglycerol 3-amino-3-carboxypropyl transferase
MTHQTEIADKARFDQIRYAQCWEDADVLLGAADVCPGDTCLSIAAAGDNTLALIGAGAKRVIAADLNPAQIACLELRVAAYRMLTHPEFLQLMGQNECKDRIILYDLCRADLTAQARDFWDARLDQVQRGIAQGGRFERYLRVFRRFLLPLTQRRRTVTRLFHLDTVEGRKKLYENHWNNRRWQLLCFFFFGRASLGRFGRDPSFTNFADETVWASLQRRLPQALVQQDPSDNPYLQWILKGRFVSALPWAWREENFQKIRDNLDALEWHCGSIENVLAGLPDNTLNQCNLSDIFEYMSEAAYEKILSELIRAGAPGCRLVYWNVVVKRSRPDELSGSLTPLRALARKLHQEDKAFFYRDLVVEEVTKC